MKCDKDRLCLDLFSGLGGFSAALEDSDEWRVFTVDIQEKFDPDFVADIYRLRPKDLPDADVILASPPCTCFSKANRINPDQRHFDAEGTPLTERAKESVALVYHTIGLIKALSPDYWILENPLGDLRKILGQPTAEVTYCQYGTDYQKPTDLWGELPPMAYKRCAAGDDCHTGSNLGGTERPLPNNPADKSVVPYGLSRAILKAVEGKAEQQTLLQTDGGCKHGSLGTDSDQ